MSSHSSTSRIRRACMLPHPGMSSCTGCCPASPPPQKVRALMSCPSYSLYKLPVPTVIFIRSPMAGRPKYINKKPAFHNGIMNLSALENIGLSKAEVQVYSALLKLGSSSSGKIVAETSLRKSTVYECINRLGDKGLVSYVIKDSMKYFEAAQPEKLLDFMQEKKREINRQEKQLNSLIPKLKSEFDFLKPRAEAHVYLGVEGFKTMRRDSLRNANGEILLIGAISREDEVMPGFYKWWNKERQAKG